MILVVFAVHFAHVRVSLQRSQEELRSSLLCSSLRKDYLGNWNSDLVGALATTEGCTGHARVYIQWMYIRGLMG